MTYSRAEIDLIKKTVAADATDQELAMFLHHAQRMELDPLARQIHFVKRGGRSAIQVGIDGYRLVASRTGLYAGNDEAVYTLDKDGNPVAASVTVWKLVGGQRCGFTSTARWAEYAPEGGTGFMWRKMPFLMLGKVAEALALRKAFPAELSGVYTHEEMDQAGTAELGPVGGVQIDEPVRPQLQAPVLPPPPAVDKCEDCGSPIAKARGKDGVIMSPADVASYTKGRFGRPICAKCAKVAAALETEAKPEVEQPTLA